MRPWRDSSAVGGSGLFARWGPGLLLAAELVVLAAAWLGAHALRFEVVAWPAPLGETPMARRLSTLAVLLPAAIVVLASSGLHRPGRTVSPRREAADAARAMIMLTLVMMVLSYALRLDVPRSALLLFAGLAASAMAALRLAVGTARAARHRQGEGLTRALIVGDGPLAAALVARMRAEPGLGIEPAGLLTSGRRAIAAGLADLVRGDASALPQHVAASPEQVVYLALEREESQLEREVLASIATLDLRLRWVPDSPERWARDVRGEELAGLPVVYLTEGPMRGMEGTLKRAFDMVASTVLLVLASPLLAVLAVIVRLDSPGPALYAQERVSRGGRRFRMWKFRTMRADAEHGTGPVWPQADDRRVTRIGKWLRRLSLDELPQLWNVARGEMSLVGPRPERPAFVERFEQQVPHYPLRLGVRAGLTGWAQIHGWRGATPLERRVEHDLYYLAHWSLALDLRILLVTVWRVMRGVA